MNPSSVDENIVDAMANLAVRIASPISLLVSPIWRPTMMKYTVHLIVLEGCCNRDHGGHAITVKSHLIEPEKYLSGYA